MDIIYSRTEVLKDIAKFRPVLIEDSESYEFVDVEEVENVKYNDLVEFPGNDIHIGASTAQYLFGSSWYALFIINNIVHKEAPIWFKIKYGVSNDDFTLKDKLDKWYEKKYVDFRPCKTTPTRLREWHEDYIQDFKRGIELLQKLRLHYLVYSLWHSYWYDQRDEKGHSRACKYVASQLVE